MKARRKTGNEAIGGLAETSILALLRRPPAPFRAPEPEPAFEVWWRGRDRKRSGKALARDAWIAALAEMGCFDDAGNGG